MGLFGFICMMLIDHLFLFQFFYLLTGHSQEAADVSISPEGHESLILTAKVMAATALRLVMDAGLRETIIEEHSTWKDKYSK